MSRLSACYWILAEHMASAFVLSAMSCVDACRMLDVGPREALRGIMMDPGGIGYDFCYGHQAYASRFR